VTAPSRTEPCYTKRLDSCESGEPEFDRPRRRHLVPHFEASQAAR